MKKKGFMRTSVTGPGSREVAATELLDEQRSYDKRGARVKIEEGLNDP